MPPCNSKADALGFYLTGAASDGAAQPDPNAALGGYRSNHESRALGALVGDPIAPVSVDMPLGANATGGASIRGSGDVLYYTPPDGTEGDGVSIADGQTKLLEGQDANKAVRVSRDGAIDLDGTMTLDLVQPFNDVLGMDNVTDAERLAGSDAYRAWMLRAHGDYGVLDIAVWIATLGTQAASDLAQLPASGVGTIQTSGSFADWPEAGFARVQDAGGTLREIVYYASRTNTTLSVSAAAFRGLLGTTASAGAATDTVDAVPGLRIALEAPAAAAIQTIANENIAPTGLSWTSAIIAGEGLSMSLLDPDNNYGLWLHRHTPAGAALTHKMQNALNFSFKGV